MKDRVRVPRKTPLPGVQRRTNQRLADPGAFLPLESIRESP